MYNSKVKYFCSASAIDFCKYLKYFYVLFRLDRVGLRRGHEEHSQWEVLRPGVTRLNLAWFSSDEES